MVVGVVVGIIVVYRISGIFVVKVVFNINVRGVGGGQNYVENLLFCQWHNTTRHMLGLVNDTTAKKGHSFQRTLIRISV